MEHMVVVVNGEIRDYAYHKNAVGSVDCVVAVDGGSRHIGPLGLQPNVVLGDFDSIDDFDAFLEEYPSAEVIQFPPRKNFTDSELAVEYAISQNPKRVTLIGCFGSRMDHTFSTLMLLKKFLDAGVEARMLDDRNEVRLINKSIDIQGDVGTNMSLVPVSGAVHGIYLHGFEYPLVDATLELGSSTGISNVFAVQDARIELSEGLLLVFKSRD